MPTEISIVIPAFNEADSLQILIQKTKNVLEQTSKSYEIIIIDDGSTDKTLNILTPLSEKFKNLKIISLMKNYGKSQALDIGFKKTSGEIIITMDADLQDDPEEIPNLIKKIDEGYDLVSGWKKQRKDPLSKIIPSRVFNFILSRLSGLKLHDFNCGIKAYRRKVIATLNIYGGMHRFIPIFAHWKGFNVTEIAVRHYPRLYGASKFGGERMLKGLFDYLTTSFIVKYLDRPMHFFGRWGIFSFLLGLSINLYLTIEWYFLSTKLSERPLLLLGILLMVMGILLLSTGFIAETIIYISKNSEQKKADYIIKKIVNINETNENK